MDQQHDAVGGRSELDLIWVAIDLKIGACLAAPSLVESLIREQSLVKEVRGPTGRADDRSGARERTAGGNHRDVWIGEDVLARAKLKTREPKLVRLERSDILLVEAVETNVVVEEKA